METHNISFERIREHFKPLKVSRNTVLLHAGETCTELYYVCSGAFRTFFIDEDGTEKTSAVAIEDYFGTAWMSFIRQLPSLELIEVVEDAELLVISYGEFMQLVATDPFWKDVYIKALEMALLNHTRKVYAIMTLDAKARYQKLLNGNPILTQKLSNKTLASFLDMREETLSRIKSKK